MIRAMPRLSFLVVLAVLVSSGAGCAWRKPEPPTAAEAQLLAELTRDPFIRVEYQVREEDGYLTVRTAQGNVSRTYRLMPANDSGGPLVIRWMDEAQVLPVAWSEDQLGTGPKWRGPRQ